LTAEENKLLPDAFLACTTGWEKVDLSEEKYVIRTEEDYAEEDITGALIDSYIHAADSMERRLNQLGVDVNSANTVEVLISDAALVKLKEHTSQQLVRKGHTGTSTFELRRFLATKYLRSRFRVPSKESWELMKTIAVQNHFKLMPLERYNNIMTCLRGYDVPSRTGGGNGDETWLRRRNLLRQLNPLEQSLFKESVSVLFNTRNGCLVIDDELIASRAQDVENKTLSARKTGGEGITADMIAEALMCLLLGTRLRVSGESQRDNVNMLLETCLCSDKVPGLTDASAKPRMKMDRGYTDEQMLMNEHLQNFSCDAICKESSRCPFISYPKYEEKLNAWRLKKHFQMFEAGSTTPMKEQYVDAKGDTRERNKLDPLKLKRVTDVFSEYVIPGGEEKLGTEVFMATKDIVKENGKTARLTATAIRDTHDKKNACKDLFFLSTGKGARENKTTFVAKPKDTYIVTSTHLFSNKNGSADRLRIEEHLKNNNCEALTIGQKCIDWFGLKANCITGTMGGKIYGKAKSLLEDELFDVSEDGIEDLRDEDLQNAMDECIGGWYGRDHVSTPAMAEGTKNEEPTFETFSNYDFVDAACEVGLLRKTDITGANIGASPDGIAIVNIPGVEGPQMVSVEIKTRVKETPIADAEEARSWAAEGKHSVDDGGKFVVCEYDDEKFKKCVPYANRKQVVHQAAVTGLSWGVFITSKVEESEGSIVQVVFVKMSQDVREEYMNTVLLLAKPLTGWLMNQAAIDRGYLQGGDLPPWMTSSATKIMKSQFKMWSAWWRHVTTVGPFAPVGKLKHVTNFGYNKGKWGLDKCTENYFKVHLTTKGLPFESTYILRMIDGVGCNSWKVEQGRMVKKFVLEHRVKNNGDNPSISAVRSKCKQLPLEGYIYQLSIDWLRKLETEQYQDIRAALALQQARNPRAQTQDPVSQQVMTCQATIAELKSKGKWPVKRQRLGAFTKGSLNAVRLLSCPQFSHHVTSVTEEKTCALCSSAKHQRKIRSACSICEVTLCTRKRQPHNTSCWEAWHSMTSTNLLREHHARGNALEASREANKETNRTKHSARMASAKKRSRAERDDIDDDDNGDTEMVDASGDSSISNRPQNSSAFPVNMV
jgi:hypothetical protein